jgi:hypothetical protein
MARYSGAQEGGIAPTAAGGATNNKNIPLEGVKNMRDLASATPIMKAGRIFRTGCVSKASDSDVS